MKRHCSTAAKAGVAPIAQTSITDKKNFDAIGASPCRCQEAG
jgi:hypothetical protein